MGDLFFNLKYFIPLNACLIGRLKYAWMKKIIGLLIVISLASCGASRSAKTKQKIAEHYPKTVEKTDFPREDLKVVAKKETEVP